ncbi:MAG: hypothetical protein ACRDCY_21985 [Aeromonas veronii]
MAAKKQTDESQAITGRAAAQPLLNGGYEMPKPDHLAVADHRRATFAWPTLTTAELTQPGDVLTVNEKPVVACFTALPGETATRKVQTAGPVFAQHLNLGAVEAAALEAAGFTLV